MEQMAFAQNIEKKVVQLGRRQSRGGKRVRAT